MDDGTHYVAVEPIPLGAHHSQCHQAILQYIHSTDSDPMAHGGGHPENIQVAWVQESGRCETTHRHQHSEG